MFITGESVWDGQDSCDMCWWWWWFYYHSLGQEVDREVGGIRSTVAAFHRALIGRAIQAWLSLEGDVQ